MSISQINKEIRRINERLDIIERQLPDRSYSGAAVLNMLSDEEYSPKIPFDVAKLKNKKSKRKKRKKSNRKKKQAKRKKR